MNKEITIHGTEAEQRLRLSMLKELIINEHNLSYTGMMTIIRMIEDFERQLNEDD